MLNYKVLLWTKAHCSGTAGVGVEKVAFYLLLL